LKALEKTMNEPESTIVGESESPFQEKEIPSVKQIPPKDYAIGICVTLIAALLIFVGSDILGNGYLSGNQFNGTAVAGGDGVTTVFDIDADVCADGKDVQFDAWLEDRTNEWETYDEIAQFECGEGVVWLSVGFNLTWDETTGDLQIIADEPPANGTNIVLDSETTPSIGSPLFLLSWFCLIVGITGSFIFGLVIARNKRGYLYGQLIVLALILLVVMAMKTYLNPCTDFYC